MVKTGLRPHKAVQDCTQGDQASAAIWEGLELSYTSTLISNLVLISADSRDMLFKKSTSSFSSPSPISIRNEAHSFYPEPQKKVQCIHDVDEHLG